jgi:hypothetical protein
MKLAEQEQNSKITYTMKNSITPLTTLAAAAAEKIEKLKNF